ncbi:phosphohydrolase [Phormidium tenue FACHB-886]|nr:phosphohydrolase [Phormidium tenue FACHB-886]
MNLTAIFQLYLERGKAPYENGGISQLDHALQSATLAEAANQPDEMIAACLFHDLGHLLHSYGTRAADNGINDRHEYRAIPSLSTLFSPTVWQPVRLHVEAKRYCCAVDPTYWERLSAGSKETLALQGGVFSDAAAAAFIKRPYAEAAVQLRRWDDQAKAIGLVTPDLEHFRCKLEACVL